VHVVDRLSSLDVSFLYLEKPSTAMHVGTVMIFRAPDEGVDPDQLADHLGSRIARVSPYRQRVRWIPGRIANPVWIDDERFDLNYHIRHQVLPRPGNDQQLEEFVARVQGEQLDRRRPLWELYLVEGLSEGRFALISKAHQALVDGVRTVDLGQLILDQTAQAAQPRQVAQPQVAQPQVAQPLRGAQPRPAAASGPSPVLAEQWKPREAPPAGELLVQALSESIRRPGQLAEAVRNGLADVRDTASVTLRTAERVVRAVRQVAGGPAVSPLTRSVTPYRRYAMITTELGDYRRIRSGVMASRPQSPTTINDVVLAVLAGALRSWLLARGEPVPPDSVVRTLVPISVRVDDGDPNRETADPGGAGTPSPIASRVDSILVDLPTGESSPMMRLHQVSYQTKSHQENGRAVRASALAGIAGFASPTLHSLGARVAGGLSRRLFHLVVSNVPGPQRPLYMNGAQMLATYPVVPLAEGQALSIGLTSYAGKVYYGLNADWEAMPDVDVVRRCIVEALAELLEAVGPDPAAPFVLHPDAVRGQTVAPAEPAHKNRTEHE
jgi:WS/DGAT/MGAT family acyltransferase